MLGVTRLPRACFSRASGNRWLDRLEGGEAHGEARLVLSLIRAPNLACDERDETRSLQLINRPM